MKFEKDEKTHKYFLDDKPLTGVTTILQVISKPQLIQWAANMAVDYLEKEVFGKMENSEEINFPLLFKEARTAHRKKKESAGDIGTEAHGIIEGWIKTGLVKKGSEDMVDTMVRNFITWAENNKVEFLESEKPVYSEEHWFAGTLDFTCIIDGKKYLGDLKTSSGIYGREYFLQTAAYRLCLEEMGEKDFHGSIIVRCGKKGDFETKESWDYDTDKEAFLAALKLYRLLN